MPITVYLHIYAEKQFVFSDCQKHLTQITAIILLEAVFAVK